MQGIFSMAKHLEESKQLIEARKIVTTSYKIIKETNQLVSLLKEDIQRQEELLVKQQEQLDELIKTLEIED